MHSAVLLITLLDFTISTFTCVLVLPYVLLQKAGYCLLLVIPSACHLPFLRFCITFTCSSHACLPLVLVTQLPAVRSDITGYVYYYRSFLHHHPLPVWF